MEVRPLFAGGDVARGRNPYLAHYRPAFASSTIRYPPPPGLALRLAFPLRGGRWAYHVPRTHRMDGLGPACPPVVALSAIGHDTIPIPDHSPFGAGLLPLWGTAPSACSSMTAFISDLHVLTMPSRPASDRLGAGSRALPSRFGRRP